ncbi:ATP-sensitive inward rectifier potassium channel 12 [Anthophora plagiata]
MEEPQKLFRLPGTIEEEEEKDTEIQDHLPLPENPNTVDSPLLGQKNTGTLSSLPRNVTLVRVSTQSSSIGGVGRQDSTRSRYRAGPTRKLRRRAVLKNGDCNVLQSRISRRSLRFLQDIFTTLVDTQWRWTLLCFSLSFVLSWLGFAVIWWLIAFTHGDFEERHLPPFQIENNWTPCIYNIFSFTSCFLFSIETQHTIGYGSRSTTEECPEAIFVMCVQSIAGVMIQAFMVGIVFAKMSRPKQRTQTLLFSRNAVICQRDGELCLMFRVGDMRKSHIIGAAVRAQLIRSRTTKEGEVLSQNQQELAVGTDGQNGNLFFIWPTTIVHKINVESPFYNMSAEEMLTERFEVVAILEGTIESTGQTTQARSSYLPQEILWGHRFEPMVTYSKERQGYEVDYSLFNSTTQVDTPLCSGKELAEFYKVQEELRHGNGMIVDEDFLGESCHDSQYHYGHRPMAMVNHHQHTHPLHYVDSGRSETSADEGTTCRNACRDSSYHGFGAPNRDHSHCKILDLDPDGIQVMGEVDLQQLPEAVNREILKNSREIIFEEPESFREGSPLLRSASRRSTARHPLLDEERRSLHSSKKSLYHRNILKGLEEEKRSLDGSRRNLTGSRKYLLIPLDNRSVETGHRESYTSARRHTGSRERLNAMRKNIGVKGSKEIFEMDPRGRVNSNDDRLMIEMEKSVKSPRQQEILSDNNRTSLSDSNLSPNVYNLSSKCRQSLVPTLPISPVSDLSPESGFYEGTQWSSSPECVKKDLRVHNDPVITRNRRSYENAQLQDVNEALSRPHSDNSSLDSEESVKNSTNDGNSRKYNEKNTVKQTAISYTSV